MHIAEYECSLSEENAERLFKKFVKELKEEEIQENKNNSIKSSS